jgi:hypothetical protein
LDPYWCAVSRDIAIVASNIIVEISRMTLGLGLRGPNPIMLAWRARQKIKDFEQYVI